MIISAQELRNCSGFGQLLRVTAFSSDDKQYNTNDIFLLFHLLSCMYRMILGHHERPLYRLITACDGLGGGHQINPPEIHTLQSW